MNGEVICFPIMKICFCTHSFLLWLRVFMSCKWKGDLLKVILDTFYILLINLTISLLDSLRIDFKCMFLWIYLNLNLKEGLEQVGLMVQSYYFVALLWSWWSMLEIISCTSQDVALSLFFAWFVWCKGWGRSLLFQSLTLHLEVDIQMVLSCCGAWILFDSS